LSAPFFVGTNNEKIEFSVGTNIPYQAATQFSGIPGAGLSQSIQREKLNLALNITPRISSGDTMRLEIEGEIKDIGEKDAVLGPTWTERKLKTQVVVRDQQTVVLGGLISERTIYSETKVPLLGDIPVLGYLFKYRTKSKKKSNLLIMLTPYLVRDQLDMQEIVERKERERNEFIRSFDSLDTRYYKQAIDYRRKRGLLEEINRTVIAIEEDAEGLRALGSGQRVKEGVIDYKVNDASDDEPTIIPDAAPDGKPMVKPVDSKQDMKPDAKTDDAKPSPSPTPRRGASLLPDAKFAVDAVSSADGVGAAKPGAR
jgi:general secretion pathway protein D